MNDNEALARAAASPAKPRIAIVGGGFSGATFATLLMRDKDLPACELTIVEPRAVLGAGLAYSAQDPLHRVNIVAERMTALPDDLADFDRWFKSKGYLDADPAAVDAERGIFPARRVFGLYIDDLVRRTAEATPHVAFRHIQTTVDAATQGPGFYRLALASGETIDADLVVLATGHPAPRLPWPLSQLPDHRGVIVNPWQAGAVAAIRPDDRVLIIGSGLTMGDTVASLRAQGHAAPLIALSRRGLVPRPRAAVVDPIPGLDFAAGDSVSAVLHKVRAQIRAAEAIGRPWSDVFDALRQQNGAIWTAWSWPERRRFQRHLRPFWDVHRFQAAPQINDLVAREQADGGLTIFAASMTKAEISGGKIAVSWRRRGQHGIETQTFDVIVNCTGAAGPLIAEQPILASLAKEGLIRADSFGTGVDVDAGSRALSGEGIVSENLLVLGPAIRGCLGEISGALEIALHADAVAKALASRLKARAIAG